MTLIGEEQRVDKIEDGLTVREVVLRIKSITVKVICVYTIGRILNRRIKELEERRL